MWNSVKKVLGIALGAGMGWFGTTIRVGLAGLSGWLIAKGVDAGTANSLVGLWEPALLGVLAALGSWLNSDAQLKKPAP